MTVDLLNSLRTTKLAVEETLWPTRCAVCDKANYLLCDNCIKNLSFIDKYKACPVCGEPYGKVQCCSCSPISRNLNKTEKANYKMNFNQCISVTRLDKDTGRIITIFKDAGEQRLSQIISYFIFSYIPKKWFNNSIISYIPSSKDSYTKRGFDHMNLIVKDLSKLSNNKYLSIFDRPKSIDQRKLSRSQREANLNNMFKIKPEIVNFLKKYETIILIDDVYTTGATLNAASKTLKNLYDAQIFCITFSRTF